MRLVLRRIGNSLGVIIPKATLDAWGLAEGDALELTPRGLRPPAKQGSAHEALDEHKRRLAAAVAARFPANAIRAHSLGNLHRWRQAGAWVSAYDEWLEILRSGDDGPLFAAMLGRDERANRLRQSPPYVGLLPRDEVARLNEQEVDLIAKNAPQRTEWLNAIGQDSPFHEEFGYYADPVDEATATLPRGWKGRLVNLPPGDTEGVRGLCLDPHDLAIAKYVARREKDREFTRELARRGLVERDRLLALVAETPVSEEVRERMRAHISADFER